MPKAYNFTKLIVKPSVDKRRIILALFYALKNLKTLMMHMNNTVLHSFCESKSILKIKLDIFIVKQANDSVNDISQMNFEFSERQKNFLSKVDRVCRSIRDNEEKSYLQEKLNDKVIPEFGKIGMLGCPISTKYGGLGYDILTYALALERIGEEGNSLRTFFSAHISIGQMVLQSWANDEQKKEYLPKTTSGKSIMGFALTEPAAGSDPASMQTKFEEKGGNFILKGKNIGSEMEHLQN